VNGKEMTLDLLFTQDQGSSIVDGINHLHNLLLSTDLFLVEFTQYIGLTPFLYLHNTSGFLFFQDGMFHKNWHKKLWKLSIDKRIPNMI